jgi:hypothetical protein
MVECPNIRNYFVYKYPNVDEHISKIFEIFSCITYSNDMSYNAEAYYLKRYISDHFEKEKIANIILNDE